MKSKQLLITLTLALGLILALWWALGLGMVPVARAAGPWYVAPGGDDSLNDCLSDTTPCATINGALAKPGFTAGDTVLVATGTYTGTGTEVVLLDKDVTLSGGWDSTFTTQSGTSTIDGEGARRGITVNSGVAAIVERFTVQNGSADEGGGINNDGSSLTLNNSIISGNTALDGGGISNSGTLTLNNSTVSGNMAICSECIGGGGILNYVAGSLTLNNSTVSGNTTTSIGGGISNIPSSGGTLTLNNSTVSGNTASRNGGGIYNVLSPLTLNNSTVSSNTAAGSWGGGGILSGDSTVTLNNSTISGNTASGGDGGGIRDPSGSFGTIILQNTILAGNTASGSGPDCGKWANIVSSGYNLIGNTSGCTFTPTTGDLINIDPLLGPLQDNGGATETHALLSSSPAIDAGNPAGCVGSTGPLLTDQRGFPRVGRCDIGAYEVVQSGKTVNESIALPGDPLTYTIVFLNEGATGTNVRVTDTLPISLTYVDNSLTAGGGSYGYNNGVISWTGSVSASGFVTISFGVTISETTPLGVSITNSAVISGGGEVTTHTATVDIASSSPGTGPIYLPIIFKNQ